MTNITAPVQAKGIVHWQIADTAKGMARAFWEDAATRGNDFYHANKSPDLFVRRCWQEFIPIARGLLTKLLGMDYHPGTITPITEAEKQAIYDALKLENAINPRQLQKSNLITPGSSLILPPQGKPNVH